MMLSLDTAYRSFGGEVEASNTPTICRLPDSRRHQLSAIAPKPSASTSKSELRSSRPRKRGEGEAVHFNVNSCPLACGPLTPRRGRDPAAVRRHDAECTVFLQPRCALVAHQRTANLAGVVAQAGADDFETFRVLVAAEPVSQKLAHAVDRRLYLGIPCEFEDGVDALPEFRIGQADHDAGAHIGMRAHGGLDFGRIDVGAAAQNHVGEPVAEIEIALG